MTLAVGSARRYSLPLFIQLIDLSCLKNAIIYSVTRHKCRYVIEQKVVRNDEMKKNDAGPDIPYPSALNAITEERRR